MNIYQFSSQQLKGKVPGKETGIEVRKTVCSICDPIIHCGIDAYVKDGVVVKVEGSKENTHNSGTLCSKGAASRQYLYHKDRLQTPLIRKGDRGSGEFERISWDDALDVIATRLLKIKDEYGPEAVLFYAGYPKWMRPFLKRLAHSFGSPNYCSESSTCAMAAALASRLNYGAVGNPMVAQTKCLLVWGTNPFNGNSPVIRPFLAAREQGLKIIEVGPLISPVTKYADIHLRLRPGTSGALALGMASIIIEEGLYDREFIEKWTAGFEEYRAYVQKFTPAKTEEITGVSAALISKAARLFASSKPAALMSGPNSSTHQTNGIQNHRALTALIGLTGNFDRNGGNYVIPPSYLYVTNGMKTRQHQFEQSRPWDEMPPRVGQDLYPVWTKMVPEAQATQIPLQIKSQKPYPIKAMLAFGLNYRMWPGSDFMKESLDKLDFVVDMDLFMTDSGRLADIILPACSTFERSELNFYARKYVIWTHPVIEPIGEARPDNDVICDLAKRLAPEDALLQEGHEACLDWIIEPTGLKIEDLKKYPSGFNVKDRSMPPFEKYIKSGFHTPSGKMEFTPTILEEAGLDPLPLYEEPKFSPISTPDVAKDFPLILTTGARIPMFIHSRTFRLPWTRNLRPDPMVDINPHDAKQRKINQGDDVSLSSPRASISVKANLTEYVPIGVVNMYHAYPEANVNLLIEPDYRDPISGFPGYKALLCEVSKAK